MPAIASVSIDARLDFSNLNRDYSRLQSEAMRNGARVGKSFGDSLAGGVKAGGSQLTSVMTGVFAGIGIGLVNAAGQGIAALGGLGKKMLEVGSNAEKSRVAFTTFLGSAQKADAVLKDIAKFAAETPFELPEVEKAARQFLAFGFTADQLKPILTNVGNIAAGTGTNFGELADIIGKAKTQGRLYAEDINQLTGRGIPIIGELAKQYGVAESEVKKLVESGKVGFPQLEKALAAMSGEGGRFEGLMSKLADTTAGKFTNLSDRITQSFVAIFKNIQPAINAALDVAAAFFDGFQVDFRNINSLAKDFAGWLVQHKDEAKAVGAAIGSFISSALKTINALAKEFTAFLKQNPGIVQAIGAAVRAVGAGYQTWGQALKAAGNLAKEIAQVFASIIGTVGKITGAVQNMGSQFSRVISGIQSRASAVNQTIRTGLGLSRSGSSSGGTTPKYEKGTRYVPSDQLAFLHKGEAVVPAKLNTFAKNSAGARGNQGAPFASGSLATDYSNRRSKFTETVRDMKYQGIERASQQYQWMEEYERRTERLIEITEKSKAKASELKNEILQGIGGAFTSAIKDVVTGTKSLGEAALDLLGNLASKLLDLGLNSILGGMGGGGGLLGGLFGSLLGGKGRTPSYAVGTPYVPTNQLAFLHQGEAVIPAKQNQNNSQSNSININITNNGEAAANPNKIAEQVRRVVEAELVRQRRPGGSIY